ncbi:hypothetical protein UPYG_G00133070 [Umbra pygmaea]|uniref:Centriole, cilia and spindle-associated protein n=1 Tax=Umbra pygmaea TaxID=75934 RepID=A0ABD0WY53_UMBPY
MVTKRIRTEYMKRFKDPKWETYAKCYEEMVKYRLTRRLLEQTHNPWFWNDDSDSESGRSTPQKNKVGPKEVKDDSQLECVRESLAEASLEKKVPMSELQADQSFPEPAPHIDGLGAMEGNHKALEEEKQGRGFMAIESEKKTDTKTKAKQTRKPSRARIQLRKPKEPDKENRHPFAMYGGGDRPVEMASKKTHNVGPAASTNKIHESALLAKTRREIVKQMQKVDRETQKVFQSAELEKVTKNKPDFDPWVTEYMRCFSARQVG